MSLALYRKYRPGRFADVIGQEHVTAPLMRALDNDRLHHAYLFTGPRGCGKTSSARIMARSMNCINGPTSTPCEECQSCIELAPNGTGSIDVIEIDAATYRGIDDAKELRERAIYAPVTARHKIYIIDEAHQLTRDAFNVLLKLVEEPPPHLRFIFATTEPDKIIPTLRSRTHHYGFRLVSAKTLQEHLARMCEQENVPADPASLALIVRAGAGSVRDSQSVLGQIIAGAGPEGITYAQTVLQLGFTDEALLSRVVTAIAEANAADLFGLIDEVVSSGHEPRRFVIDLLERLRDLVVLKQVPDAASSGLFDVPAEQIADMAKEAELFTAAQLVRVADLVNSGLSTLRGASSPRLQLELLVARLVTPQVAEDLSERVAKLEQGTPVASIRPSANRVQHAHPIEPKAESPAEIETPKVEAAAKPVPPRPVTRPTAPPPMKPSQVTSAAPAQETPVETPAAPAGTEITLENVKAGWASVLTHLKELRRVSFMIMQDTVPLSLTSDRVLAVACSSPNNMQGAIKGGHDELLRTAIATVLGADVRIELTVDSARATAKPASSTPTTEIAEAIDPGDASPDDANVPTHAVIDMVTNIMGGRVISESPRE